ncbi:DUF6542 domain-containing protein [Actinomadura atramentaria]|uniref:DUF6542 domain-containing protein n=1 Tax=Actinomadura atramentaria TaxID=1990 RepID=UPI000374F78E|nr:DUF6542 domain-containing protein [Actinomadura atramentaria]
MREPRPRPAGRNPAALTGRGGIVVLFAAALAGALAAHWTGTGVLAGLAFLLGCAAAALLTRPADLLTLAVSPPLVFFAATLAAVIVVNAGEQSPVRSIALGLLTALAGTAPWLFAGTVLVVVVTAPRGMLAQVRDLRGRLAGLRLFHEEENADPVRWDDSRRREPPAHHADVD